MLVDTKFGVGVDVGVLTSVLVAVLVDADIEVGVFDVNDVESPKTVEE